MIGIVGHKSASALAMFWLAMLALTAAILPTATAQLPAPVQPVTLTPFIAAPLGSNPRYVRFGAPITFSGRILPADATGTLTFTVDGVPATTVPLSTQTLADYVSLGDFITYGGYLADPNQRYPALVAKALNLSYTNQGVPGYLSCDVMPLEVLLQDIGITPAISPLYSLLIGTNDVDAYSTGANEAVFNACHQATLAWLGVPRAGKVFVGDPAVAIRSGAWSATPVGPTLSTLANTTGFGSLRITLTTTGAPAYLWYALQTSSPGSFTVSVDGGPASSPVQTLLSVPLEPSLSTSYSLLRLPVAAGTHTFDIAAKSGTVAILAMGSPPPTAGPTVLAGDIPNQMLPNLTHSSPAGIAAYTADIKANIALLHADGLDIRFVPTQAAMLATPAEMMDVIHPNALGLSEIAQAFAAAVTPASPVADTTLAATASFTTASLPIGSHGIGILYSGDAKYAPADAGTLTESIYDGTSTTSLAADAAIYTIQSPVTLTATVAQPEATGLIVFSDQFGPIGSAWLNEPNFGAAHVTLPNLPPGIHTVTAQYQGDAHFNRSISPAVAIDVAAAYTTTALNAPATRFYAATPVSLTATVIPTSTAGTVLFADGNTPLGQAPLVSGAAAFTTGTLAPGIHPLTAAFSGNATQNPSQSPVLSIQIDPNSSIVAIAPVPASIPYGTPLPITASVSPTSATGTVAIADGTATLGQPALVNTVATLTAANLALGPHTFTATYSGDANDLPSVSSSVSTVITLAPATVALAAIPASTTVGTPIHLSATVNPSAATGTITFNDGGTTVAQAPLANGAAIFTIATLAPGTHTFTATYSGDTFRAASTSPAVSTTVTLLASTISLAPLPSTVNIGNAITLSATVSPAAATGTVLFRDQTLGILGQATIANGVAAVTLSSPAAGTYSITATYSGDIDDTPATSAAITAQVVLNSTATTLAAAPTATTYATPIIFTASITPAVSGPVSFFDGATLLGNALAANGTAALTSTILGPGSHTLHATYVGNSLYAASTSAAIAVTIDAQPTTITLSLAQNPVIAANSIVANIRVAASNSSPTGTVTLRSGATILASSHLANASGGFAYTTLTVPAATLGIGTFPLTAIYSGDPTSQPSDTAASPISVTVNAIPTATTLSLSSPQIPIEGSVTLTAYLTSPNPAPAGSIVFSRNGTALATVPLTSAGTASYTFTATAAGTFPITAAYTANGLYASSTSPAQTLTVTPPLAASFSPAAISAASGDSPTATLALTPLSGFTGPIQTTCATSAVFLTCTVVAPNALSTPTSVPVKITVSRTAALVHPSLRGIGGITLALLLPLLVPRSRRRTFRILALSLLFLGCGEGGSFANLPPRAQTLTVTIIAAGTTIPATLTVNITD